MPAAPHQRFCAKGKSVLMVRIFTSPRFAASWLNLRTSVSHTGVSTDGTAQITRTFPALSLRVTGFMSLPVTVKFGAGSPAFNSGPTRVKGFPRIVVPPGRSIDILFSCLLIDWLLNDYTLKVMLLYLVRHAEALQADPRPLSPFGRRQAEDLALQAAKTGARPARSLHSGKLRA